MSETARARDALRHIDAGCPRDEWAIVGMAMKDAGLAADDFIEWSRSAPNFGGEKDCRAAWKSFKPGSTTEATLFAKAIAAGWRPPPDDDQRERPKRPQAPRKSGGKAERPALDFAAVWRDSEAATAEHPYIARKLGLPDGLRVCRGALTVAGQAIGGALLVPVYDAAGELQSWQAIPAEGDKRSAPGAPIKGGSFIVGGAPGSGEPLYIAEGIGAAWSAHQATGKPAAVCFGAGNVDTVAALMRERFPAAHLVVVADRGKESDAARIARAVGGSWVGLPPEWPANSDVNDLHQRDGLAAVAELLAQARTPRADSPATDEPREIDLAALATREPRPPAFLVPDWLPSGEVTLLAADGGAGKSATALHLGVCTAAGRDFHGLPVQRRRVDFISFEDSEAVIHWRLHRLCRALGIDFAGLVGWLRVFDGTRCLSAWFARGEFGAYGPTAAFHGMAERIGGPGRVVIVDGSSDTFAGSEIDRAQVKAFIRMLRRLVADDGALLLLAHVDKLSAKSGAESLGFSGSTGWNNGVRCRWFMYAEGDDESGQAGDIVVEVRKSNLGPSGARMTLRYDPEAHIFRRVDKAPARGRPMQRADEADAIVGAIRAAWQADDPIPAAMTGQRTAHSVCEAHADFPESLKGRAGKRRFGQALEQLRAAGKVGVADRRKANRHVIEVLYVRD